MLMIIISGNNVEEKGTLNRYRKFSTRIGVDRESIVVDKGRYHGWWGDQIFSLIPDRV